MNNRISLHLHTKLHIFLKERGKGVTVSAEIGPTEFSGGPYNNKHISFYKIDFYKIEKALRI